jgi:dodecin
MTDNSVYRVTELIGVSSKSWEDAAASAIATAAKTVKDLRIGEVVKLDLTIDEGKVTGYRARLNVSFKYHTAD